MGSSWYYTAIWNWAYSRTSSCNFLYPFVLLKTYFCECKKEQIDKIEKEHLVIEREHLGKEVFDKVQIKRKFAKEEQRVQFLMSIRCIGHMIMAVSYGIQTAHII